MEIESRGDKYDKKYRVLCHKCESILIIQKKDAFSVKCISRKLIFICPVCCGKFVLDGVYG